MATVKGRFLPDIPHGRDTVHQGNLEVRRMSSPAVIADLVRLDECYVCGPAVGLPVAGGAG